MKKNGVLKKFKYFMVIILEILFVVSQNSYGQDVPHRGVLTTPSPEVASLLRNVMNPVDLYTGVASVQIPLYTGESGEVQLPVTLNYRTSGVKVHDLPTWVGLGWNLSVGGKITRVVRGRPDSRGHGNDADECYRNYYNYTTAELSNMVQKGEFDFEPDLYFFEIPGRSGMFVRDRDNRVYTIPYMGLHLREESGFFTLTDENGWVYTFGKNVKESTSVKSYGDGYEKGKTVSYTSVWYLEKIETTNGRVVNFSYLNGETLSYLDYNIRSRVVIKSNNYYGSWRPGTITSETIPYKQSEITIQPKYLQSISVRNVNISFESSLSHAGGTNLRRLDNVKVRVDQRLIKTINLKYTTFANGCLKLDEVDEIAGEDRMLVARFTYNTSRNLPRRDTKDFDHWGYYNGASNQGYRPTFTYMADPAYAGASREPSFEHTKANILTKVWNNLGGYTEYVYGRNLDRGGSSGDIIVGGVRLDSIKQYTGNPQDEALVTVYKYVLANGRSSGTRFAKKNVYVPPYIPEKVSNNTATITLTCPAMSVNSVFDLNGSPICYSRVQTVYPNKSSSVFEYTSYNDEDCGDIPMDYAGMPADSDWVYFLTPTSRFYKRGLVKNQTDYDKNGSQVSRVENTYKEISLLKGVVFGYCPIQVMVPGGWVYTRFCYRWEVAPVLLQSSVVSGRDKITTSTEYEYDENYLLPVKTEQRNAANDVVNKTTMTYPFHYSSSNIETDTVLFALGYMRDHHICAVPVEQVQYRNNKVVGATVNEYQIHHAVEQKIAVPYKTKELLLKESVTDYVTYSGGTIDSRMTTTTTALEYDYWGNLLTKRSEPGKGVTSYVYEYFGTPPVAEVYNAEIAYPFHRIDFERKEVELPSPVMYGYDFIINSWGRGVITLKLNDMFSQPQNIGGSIRLLVNGSVILQETFTLGTPFVREFEIPRIESDYANLKFCQLVVEIPNPYVEQFYASINLNYMNETYHPKNRLNQVHYTSFESEVNTVELQTAKTGRKVLKQTYSINLENFRAGEYLLTYWKSMDGVTWTKQSERVTVTATTTGNKVIGSTSFYIDEVSFIPVDARIVTNSYLPGIGKTSETDYNGQTIYYEYDKWGRLIKVLNNDRQSLKEYEYFIKQ